MTRIFPTAKMELFYDTVVGAFVIVYRYSNGVTHYEYNPSDALLRLNIPGLKNIRVVEKK